MKKRLFTLAFLSAIVCLEASAHYLWIEITAPVKLNAENEIRIYYGEFNEGVREVKGGRLEELDGIQAWVIGPDNKKSPLKISIADKYYRSSFVPTTEGTYRVIAINKVREVVDWSQHDIGIVWPVYYTSKEITTVNAPPESKANSSSVTEAELLVLPGSEKNSFLVTFRGKPLAKAKVLFHAPNEWSKELATDENGSVTFSPLWKGQYIIECIHKEKVSGKFKDKSYEAIRHRATFSAEVQ